MKNQPEIFSTDVAARPVLQSLIFPTLAYVGGPSELKYHEQLHEYFAYHHLTMPIMVPRLSSTFVTPYAAEVLEKSSSNPWDNIPMHWNSLIPELEDGIDELKDAWQTSISSIFEKEFTPHQIEQLVRQPIEKIRYRLLKKRLSMRGLSYNSLHFLRNLIQPHNKPQERVLNWLAFQSLTSQNLIQEFLTKANWRETYPSYSFIE